MKAEIDTGYPVLLFLQDFGEYFRPLAGMPRANPGIHGMLAYGYYISGQRSQYVRYRTSWGSGNNMFHLGSPNAWEATMPVRGVIGYHPLPKIQSVALQSRQSHARWDGPAAQLYVRDDSSREQRNGRTVTLWKKPILWTHRLSPKCRPSSRKEN